MNLRILKKLSKRAAPLLVALDGYQFGKVEHFTADREGFTHTTGHDRKHWERMRGAHDEPCSGSIAYRPRKASGRYPFVRVSEPFNVWPGTPMVGWTSGYETPEWEERTAWEHLADIIVCEVTEYREVPREDDEWGPGYDLEPVTRERLRNPRDVLRRARDLVLERQGVARGRTAGAHG